jgi:hypothetical protein
MDKGRVLFSHRCLHEIDAKDIIILHCLALGSSKYKKRLTWIIDTLQEFMTRERTMGMQECIKFIARINRKKVCNACYILAIGYLKSGLTDLIAKIQNTIYCTSLYGKIHH